MYSRKNVSISGNEEKLQSFDIIAACPSSRRRPSGY